MLNSERARGARTHTHTHIHTYTLRNSALNFMLNSAALPVLVLLLRSCRKLSLFAFVGESLVGKNKGVCLFFNSCAQLMSLSRYDSTTESKSVHAECFVAITLAAFAIYRVAHMLIIIVFFSAGLYHCQAYAVCISLSCITAKLIKKACISLFCITSLPA